jgi:hypothetical protein
MDRTSHALQFLKSAGWSALLNNQTDVRGRPLDISQGLPRKPKAHSFRFRIDGPSAGMATATEQSTTSASRALFLLFDEAQRARLFANIAAAMQGVRANITDRQIDLFPTGSSGVRRRRLRGVGPAILIGSANPWDQTGPPFEHRLPRGEHPHRPGLRIAGIGTEG